MANEPQAPLLSDAPIPPERLGACKTHRRFYRGRCPDCQSGRNCKAAFLREWRKARAPYTAILRGEG